MMGKDKKLRIGFMNVFNKQRTNAITINDKAFSEETPEKTCTTTNRARVLITKRIRNLSIKHLFVMVLL